MISIEGILFDKDGTLFDFHAMWSGWAQAFLTEISGGDTERAQIMGHAIGFDFTSGDFAANSPAIAGTPGEVAELLLPFLPGTSPAGLITRMNTASALAPLCEAAPLIPLLEGLAAQGIRLGLATNDAEAPARTHLKQAGVVHHFDFVAGCDSGFGAKPGTGQLMAFADFYGLSPKQVLMVGDSRHDLMAGRAAGMGTVGVLTGMASREDLVDLADVVLPDIGHLPSYLMAQAA